jgi:hypothetical protein
MNETRTTGFIWQEGYGACTLEEFFAFLKKRALDYDPKLGQAFQASLRDANRSAIRPGVETQGYSQASLRDGETSSPAKTDAGAGSLVLR